MLCGVLNCPGPLPGSPNDASHLPFLSTFAMRELIYPSLMYALPSGSHATSVTCRNIPSTGGSGGLGCFSGAVPSSDASCLRPKTITTCAAWSNFTTWSEPLSVTQILSCGSILTVCANDQA